VPATRHLVLETLDAAGFAPFGDVIDARAACARIPINEGRTLRHHDLARVDSGDDGVAAMSLFRADPVDAAFVMRRLERHPLASQAFINVSRRPFAVVVAPPGDLDESRIRGFLASGDQSVNYHRGTWHHYLLALDAPSDFVVIDRIGPGNNCDEQDLATPLMLELPR
jgi:ureidoglycolate lyase